MGIIHIHMVSTYKPKILYKYLEKCGYFCKICGNPIIVEEKKTPKGLYTTFMSWVVGKRCTSNWGGANQDNQDGLLETFCDNPDCCIISDLSFYDTFTGKKKE